MQRYFCDNCNKEILIHDIEAMDHIVSGNLYVKRKNTSTAVKVWIDWKAPCRDITHICGECLFDVIKALDHRTYHKKEE